MHRVYAIYAPVRPHRALSPAIDGRSSVARGHREVAYIDNRLLFVDEKRETIHIDV